ncbi:MAG: hypothetical protein MN733_10790 [Nitrososphaera sp.]|nr:hypothetical protein [Nitrososphaera sp.]
MKDSTIIELEQFSAQRVDAMRKLLKEATSDRDFTIIANGSFARLVAS